MVCIDGKEKLMVSCDWLQWTGYARNRVSGQFDICCPETYRLEILGGTNVFQHRGILYDYRGRKVLTILWAPYSRAMNKDLIMFEVSNYWLYTTMLPQIVEVTQQVVPYFYCGLARFDLCCDFEFKREQNRIVSNLYKGKWYVSNKKDGANWWKTIVQRQFPNQLSFGSKHSDVKWKVYDKSLELGVSSKHPEKPYIFRQWEALGMDIYGVWREEVSCRMGNKLTFQGHKLELEDIIDNYKMFHIFKELEERRFIIRKGHKHTRSTRDERVWLFKLPDYRDTWVQQNGELGTRKGESEKADNLAVINMNKLMQVLESPVARMNVTLWNSTADALFELVVNFNLAKYFETKMAMKIDKYLEVEFSKCGAGVFYVE